MRRSIQTLVLATAFLAPAAAQEMSYGEAEYLNSCAVCHGFEGLGDGPLADELQTRPADLTQLAQKNGGEFPYWHVFATIDGRFVVPGHGERDMPVWGRQFLEGDVPEFGPKGGEAVTTARLSELTDYVQSLQR